MKSFEFGNPYFLLWFYDEDFKYPNIVSLVFIQQEYINDSEVWMFQDIESFVDFGAYSEYEGKDRSGKKAEKAPQANVFEFTVDQLDTILSTEELVNQLRLEVNG